MSPTPQRPDDPNLIDIRNVEALIEAAAAARRNAYAPYSLYAVGAALLSETGQIFSGCNVENASYGATLCAERVAGAAAVAAGQRQNWRAMAVVTSGGGAPCGLCRQFLSEFQPALTFILLDADHLDEPNSPRQFVSLLDLFPTRFSADDLPT